MLDDLHHLKLSVLIPILTHQVALLQYEEKVPPELELRIGEVSGLRSELHRVISVQLPVLMQPVVKLERRHLLI